MKVHQCIHQLLIKHANDIQKLDTSRGSNMQYFTWRQFVYVERLVHS